MVVCFLSLVSQTIPLVISSAVREKSTWHLLQHPGYVPTLLKSVSFGRVYTRSNDPCKGQRMRKMCSYSSIWKQPASSEKWRADSLSSKLDSHTIFCPLALASRKFPCFGSGISHPNRNRPFQNRRKKGDPNTYYL